MLMLFFQIKFFKYFQQIIIKLKLFYQKVLTLLIRGVYLIDQLGPTYKQLQTGVREKEKVETKGESDTKS